MSMISRFFVRQGFHRLLAEFDKKDEPKSLDRADARDVADPSERSRIIKHHDEQLESLRLFNQSNPVGAPSGEGVTNG